MERFLTDLLLALNGGRIFFLTRKYTDRFFAEPGLILCLSVPMDLTPFEIRQEEDDDIIEVYPGPG